MSYRDRRDSHSSSRDRYGERRSGASTSRRSPSPPPRPRSDKELPESFGRVQELIKDDDSNVLQRMSKKFVNAPLGSLAKCLEGTRKIKVWTRNFKEVRGICTGYIIAFDKHWNLVMGDVDEVYLRRKKHKTPFFEDLQVAENFEELPPRIPRERGDPIPVEPQENQPPAPVEASSMEVETATTEMEAAATTTTERETAATTEKKTAAAVTTEMKTAAAVTTEMKTAAAVTTEMETPAAATEIQGENENLQDATTKNAAPKSGVKGKKKKRPRKKKSSAPKKRNMRTLFIRGDSIVMAAILDVEDKL